MKRALLALGLIFATTGALAEAPLTKRALVAVRQGPLPATVSRFANRLDRLKASSSLFQRVRPLLVLPLTLRETAYEKAGGSCLRYFHEKQVSDAGETIAILKRLAAAFHTDPLRDLGEGSYGVAPEEPCSHIASVRLDAKGSRIELVALDAEDPVWTPARREFSSVPK